MNVVLISSESRRQIDEEIKKIIKKSTNIIKYDLASNSLEDIINEAAYMSLLDEHKFIIVKNSDIFNSVKMKDFEIKLFEDYLSNPNDNTTIIFTTTKKIASKNKIVSLIKEKYSLIDIPKLKEYDLIKKIIADLKKEKYILDYENAKYIVKNCLNNYDIIYNELDKIKLYYNEPTIIKTEDLKFLISSTLDDNVFKLISAIIEKNDKLMFKLFNDLKIYKEDPIMFIALLAREYRFMYIIKNNKDLTESELIAKLNIQKWQFDKFIKNSYNYKPEELEEKITQLFLLDKEIKQGKIDKYLGFETFLLNV